MRYWLWSVLLSAGLFMGGAGVAGNNQTITDDIDPVGIIETPDPIPGALTPAGADPSHGRDPSARDRLDPQNP